MTENLPDKIRPLNKDESRPRDTFLFRFHKDARRETPRLVPFRPGHQPPERLQGRELRAFYEEFFAGEASLEELYPFRLGVAWRIVREMCMLRGVLKEPNQTLHDATKVAPSPWTNPFYFFGRVSGDRQFDDLIEERSSPLLPPDIPGCNRNGTVDGDYDPRTDEALRHYCRLIDYVANIRLRIPRTLDGRYGMAGLVEPELVRIAMPHPDDIMAWEVEVVRETMSVWRTGRSDDAERWLSERFDLHDTEIVQVLAMARDRAVHMVGLDDLRGAKAILLQQMEALHKKLGDAIDYRGQMLLLKEMWRIRRDTGHGGVDELDEYDRVVEETARKRRLLASSEKHDTLEEDNPIPNPGEDPHA